MIDCAFLKKTANPTNSHKMILLSLLFFSSLFYLLPSVDGEITTRHFEVPRYRFGQMFSFGFLSGGTANVTLISSVKTIA